MLLIAGRRHQNLKAPLELSPSYGEYWWMRHFKAWMLLDRTCYTYTRYIGCSLRLSALQFAIVEDKVQYVYLEGECHWSINDFYTYTIHN